MLRSSQRFGIALGASLAAAAALVAMLLWRPQGEHAGRAAGEPLVVFCAAGVRRPVEAAIQRYEQELGQPVQIQYGGSQTLLANLEVARRGDLYVPGDESYIGLARDKDLVAESIPLARMTAVLAVRKGNPKGIRSLDDLARARVAIGQADPGAAAIGKLVEAALAPTGRLDAIRRNTVVFKPTVNDVASDLALGTIDAAFVWDTIVAQQHQIEAVHLPELAKATARVSVGVLRSTTRSAVALRLARYLAASDRGLVEFAGRGFGTEEGDTWSASPELVLYSGAMNRGAVDDTIRRFEEREGAQVTRVYNGCGILVAQIKAGGRPDAYLTCDASFVPPVGDLFLGPPVEMSDSEIVILVARGNPKSLHGLADLARPGLRIGVANAEQSTLGALTRRLLERGGILDPVMANVVSQTPTADLLVNQARTGSLDAVVVYISNTMRVRDHLDVVRLHVPGSLAVQTYSVGKASPRKQLARRLLEALRSSESRARYQSEGFHWRGGAVGPAGP
jgi:molybdate transport system substrate-binding protein